MELFAIDGGLMEFSLISDKLQYLEVTDYQLFVVNTIEKWIGFYL